MDIFKTSRCCSECIFFQLRRVQSPAQSSQSISPEQPKLISVMLKMALNIIRALFPPSSQNIFLSPDNVLEMAQKPGGVIKGTGSLAWSHSKDACIGLSHQMKKRKPGVRPSTAPSPQPFRGRCQQSWKEPWTNHRAPVPSPQASPGSSQHIHLGATF